LKINALTNAIIRSEGTCTAPESALLVFNVETGGDCYGLVYYNFYIKSWEKCIRSELRMNKLSEWTWSRPGRFGSSKFL